MSVLPILIASVWVLSSFRSDPKLGGDVAVIEIDTRSAIHGEALLGPYSRFGWNHPGPAFFYWSAPFYALSGQAVGGLGVAALVLLLVCLALACILTVGARGRAGAIAFVITSAWWFVAAGTNWYDNMWNPVTIIGLVVLAGVSVAAFAGEVLWAITVAAVAGSAAVQTHVGTVPVIGTFALVAVVIAVARLLRNWRLVLPHLVWSVVAAIAVWLPPLIEQARSSPGNISRLLASEAAGSTPSHTAEEVMDLLVGMLTLGDTNLVATALTNQMDLPAATPLRIGWLVVVVLLLVAGVALAVNDRRWFDCVLALLPLLGMCALVLSLRTVSGDLKGYLALSGVALGFLIHLSIVLTIGTQLARWFDSRATALAGLVMAITAMTVAVAVAVITHGTDVVARRPGVEGADDSLESLEDALGPAQRVKVELVDPEVWTAAVLVVNELERSGWSVTVSDSMLLWIDDGRRSHGCEDVEVRVLRRGKDSSIPLERADLQVLPLQGRPACSS